MSKDRVGHSLAEELVEHLRLAGVEGLPEEWFAEIPARAPVEKKPDRNRVSTQAVVSPVIAASKYSELSLEALEVKAKACRDCRLCEERNSVVFGVGAVSRPAIAFVGEGPGADEDRLGEPFVGKAGALLTAAITKGLGLRREDVYICNVVKCRPPGNRAPLPDEVSACLPYLHGQLEKIQPQVIVTLGGPAQQALSGIDSGITKIRGQWQEWRGIPLMPTFHPAYILRNAQAKRPFWEDLQAVMEKVGIDSAEKKVNE